MEFSSTTVNGYRYAWDTDGAFCDFCSDILDRFEDTFGHCLNYQKLRETPVGKPPVGTQYKAAGLFEIA